MALDLKQDIFQPVVAKVKKRIDSLRNVKRFSRAGIEGWFKVEIVAALGDKIASLKNKGPDLGLEDGTYIEIKAATNFDKSWCVVEPLRKYNGTPVLFLADGDNPAKLTKYDDLYEIVDFKVVSDGMHDWLLGLVKQRT